MISLKDTWDSFVTCKPKMRAALSWSKCYMGRHEDHMAHGVVCIRRSRARAGEKELRWGGLQSSAPLNPALALPQRLHLPPSSSPACLPACSPAPLKGFSSFSVTLQALNQAILILCVLCKHAYDMFTRVHMLVVARVQHLASSSITNNHVFLFLFFYFETESL